MPGTNLFQYAFKAYNTKGDSPRDVVDCMYVTESIAQYSSETPSERGEGMTSAEWFRGHADVGELVNAVGARETKGTPPGSEEDGTSGTACMCGGHTRGTVYGTYKQTRSVSAFHGRHVLFA